MFEYAVAIGETTLLGREDSVFAPLGIEQMHAGYDILGLGSVCAYVLHGGRAHGARDERQILRAPQPALHAPRHEVIPLHGSSRLDRHRLVILREDVYAANVGFEQRAVEITREQYVIAAAENVKFSESALGGKNMVEILRGVEHDEPPRLLVSVETVKPAQRMFLKFPYHALLFLGFTLLVDLAEQLLDGPLQLLVAPLNYLFGRVGHLHVGFQLGVFEIAAVVETIPDDGYAEH